MTDLYIKEFDEKLHKRIKIRAITEDLTIKELCTKALKEYLDRKESKGRKPKGKK